MLETPQPPARPRASIRVRFDELDRALEAIGHSTDASKAAYLGISPAALSKLRNGRQGVSSAFIAAVRTALPALSYERLFREEVQ
ncbi:hypothetical protein AB0I61_17140 [Polymorphospora rubra]|uniref:hypothetical protein n=1 Tax=Polymorphospora rubra TaxID=338584 RepID=UPI0033DACB00